MDEALAQLVDKQAITQLLHRYCRGVDRCDVDLIRSVYHEGSVDNHGYWTGSGHDFAEFIVGRLTEANTATLHSVTNVLVELDGDAAACEAHVYASMVRRGGELAMADFFAGRYLDRLERRNGQWGVVERRVVMDWVRSGPVGPGSGWPVPLEGFAAGARTPDDPSDGMFRW